MTSEHCAFASMFIFPHAEMAACAIFGTAANAVKATIVEARRAQELREIFFMAAPGATDEPDARWYVSLELLTLDARSCPGAPSHLRPVRASHPASEAVIRSRGVVAR